MPGALEDIFRTRTDNNTKGTISTEWNRVLLWRDLERLMKDGFVESIACPSDAESFLRERQCFRDLATGEVYVYVAGWERGSPEFRKQEYAQD
jgi:hypothetical protein